MKKIKIESPIRFAFFILLLTSVLVGLVYGAYYLYKGDASGRGSEARAILEEVGKLVILPEGEEPSIATVTDLGPLRGQEFFKNAQIGDKLIIFSVSKKAILYRPTTNNIVEIAPINSTKP